MRARLVPLCLLAAVSGWGRAEAAAFYGASAFGALSLVSGQAGFETLEVFADPLEETDADPGAEAEVEVGDATAEASAAGEALDGAVRSIAFGARTLLLANPTDVDVALSFLFAYALFAEIGLDPASSGEASSIAEAALFVESLDDPFEFRVDASLDDPLAAARGGVPFDLIVPSGGELAIQFTVLAEGAAVAEPSGAPVAPIPLPGAAASLAAALAALVAAGGRGRRDRV
jgi:hypothetical protein